MSTLAGAAASKAAGSKIAAKASKAGSRIGLKKAERTRQLLLDAALRVISRKGYSSATVDEIVKEAGVSKGVAYYHFKNKAALASDILSRGVAQFAECFEDVVAASDTAEESLIGMLDVFASELYDNREFASFLMTELWRDGRVWSEGMADAVGKLVEIIAGQLKRGQDEGVVRADLDVQFGAVSIVGMCLTDAMFYAGLERDALLDKEAFTARIRDFASKSITA